MPSPSLLLYVGTAADRNGSACKVHASDGIYRVDVEIERAEVQRIIRTRLCAGDRVKCKQEFANEKLCASKWRQKRWNLRLRLQIDYSF